MTTKEKRTRQEKVELCQQPCRACQAVIHPSVHCQPLPMAAGDTGPWLMGWGDTAVLLRLWPCSLLALCLQDQGGLI